MTTCLALRSKAWCTHVISQGLCLFSCRSADRVIMFTLSQFSSGAVKRSKLEKLEPSISYESFVEDLDPGDWFTTTLTELLVRVRQARYFCSPSLPTMSHHRRRWPSAVNDKQPTVG